MKKDSGVMYIHKLWASWSGTFIPSFLPHHCDMKILLRVDVIKVYLFILYGESSVIAYNNTTVLLILKVKKPRSLKYFRPMSLYNVIYKIVTKTLANRLKLYLDPLISQNQSAFYPERLTTNKTIEEFETMHSISRRTNGTKG